MARKKNVGKALRKGSPAKPPAKAPPKTDVFERNKLFEFHRGFAFKVGKEKAKEMGLETNQKVVWVSPDGKSILPEHRAVLNNARRRSALNLSDSWNDFKSVDPTGAKELGWNGFQKTMRGTKGSRVGVLQKFQGIGIDFESVEQLKVAADGQSGDNNGWGDSG